MSRDNEWRTVVWAADCDEDGNCPACGEDFGDCDCYGPTQEGLEYKEVDGVLYARRQESSNGGES